MATAAPVADGIVKAIGANPAEEEDNGRPAGNNAISQCVGHWHWHTPNFGVPMGGRQCRNEPAMECPWEWEGAEMRKLWAMGTDLVGFCFCCFENNQRNCGQGMDDAIFALYGHENWLNFCAFPAIIFKGWQKVPIVFDIFTITRKYPALL